MFGWRIKLVGLYLNITLGVNVCADREKDEDEGVPSETEEDRRQQENRAKEIRGEHPLNELYCILFYPVSLH